MEQKSIMHGYSRSEEMTILNHFRRNLDKGMDLETAKNSLTGLDVWLVRHQGASAVKKFIESRFVEVAHIMSKKKEKKMKPGHCELLRKAFKENPGQFSRANLDEPLKSPSLVSLASTLSMHTGAVEGSVVTTVSNRSKVSLTVGYSLSKIDELIVKAAEKGLRNIDQIEALQKNDSESSLIHGARVQEAYDQVLENGKLTHDTNKLTDYLDILEKEYNELTNKELESLGKYAGNEVIDELISEYSNGKLYTDNKKIQDDLFSLVNDKLDELQQLLDDGVELESVPDAFLQLAKESVGNRRNIVESQPGEDNVEKYEGVLREFEDKVVNPVQQKVEFDLEKLETDTEELNNVYRSLTNDEEEAKKEEIEQRGNTGVIYDEYATELALDYGPMLYDDENEDLEEPKLFDSFVETVEDEELKTDKNPIISKIKEQDWSHVDLESPFLDYTEKQVLMDGNCIDFKEAANKLREAFPNQLNRTQKYTYLFCLKRFKAMFQIPETSNIRDDPKKSYYDIKNFIDLWNSIVGDKSIIIYEYVSNLNLLTKEYCLKELSKYHSVPLEPKKYRKVISKRDTRNKFEMATKEVVKENEIRERKLEEYCLEKDKLETYLDKYKKKEHKIAVFKNIKIDRLNREIEGIQSRIERQVPLPMPTLKDCIVYKHKIRNEWKNWSYIRTEGAEAAYERRIIEPYFRPKYEDINVERITTNSIDYSDYQTRFAVLNGTKIEIRKKVKRKSTNFVKFSKLTLKVGIYSREDMEQFLRKELLKIDTGKLSKRAKCIILNTANGTLFNSLRSLIAFGFITKHTCNLTKKYRLKLARSLQTIIKKDTGVNLYLDNNHALPEWKR